MIVLFFAELESSTKPEILGLFNNQEEFDVKAPQILEQIFDDNYKWAVDSNYSDYYQCTDKAKYVTDIMRSLNKCGEAANVNTYGTYFYKEKHEVK